MEQARISSTGTAQAPQATRNPRQGSDAAGAAAPGGFLALLAALEGAPMTGAGAGGEPGGALAGSSEASDGYLALPSDDASEVLDAAAMAAWHGLVPPSDGAVSQSRTAAALSGDEGAVVSRWSGALTGGQGQRQGLVAETAQLDGAADTQAAGLQGPVAGYGRILSRMQSALAQRGTVMGAGPSDATASARAGAASAVHPAAVAHQAAASNPLGGDGAAWAAAQSAGQTQDRPAGAMPGAPSSIESGAQAISGLATGVAAQGGHAQAGGRSADGGPGAGTWMAGVEGPHTPEMEGVDAAAVFGDPAQAAAEDQVAEQVTYWVNQKTQNAELTLQREGQPVEVSVTLSGNEAHVTFRSDQAETRELLDRSMSQLSELLRSEGLVLSGMSVGTSARDGGGAGEAGQQRQREGGRQAQVVSSASAAGNAAAAREGVARDGTVDIFV